MDWIKQVFSSPGFSIAALPASLLLGFLTALSSCCNFGVIAAVAGFAGSHGETLRRRDAVSMSVFFMIGTVISLSLMGWLVGHFGEIAGPNLRRYGTAIMGFAAIVAGLASLKLVPFRLPSISVSKMNLPSGFLGPVVFGLVVGGASIACSLACSGPLISVVFGMAAIRGQGIWGAALLGMFAIGYGFPPAALLLGVGLGRATSFAQRALAPIRIVAGIGLTGVGFWLLATM